MNVRRVLAGAGIAGPILFTVVFIVEAARREGYSHVADPVSALAAGPNGWVQDANFLVFGALMVAFAIGLRTGIETVRGRAAGTVLLVLSGVGLMLAGVFPARDASGAFATNPPHVVAAFLAFLGAGLGLIVTSRRMAVDERWRGPAGYTMVSGVATVVLFLAVGALAIPPEAPLHSVLGLGQRVTLVAWLPCVVALSLRAFSASSTSQMGVPQRVRM